jgi:hypothetical protein
MSMDMNKNLSEIEAAELDENLSDIEAAESDVNLSKNGSEKMDESLSKIKSLALQKVKLGGTGKPAPELQPTQEKTPKSIEEFNEIVNSKIVKTRYFKTGKVDEHGNVVGIKECVPGSVPHVHQEHHYDNLDRVIKFEKYEQNFSKPLTRFYFYEGADIKLGEGVWLDRYGKIDNIHRYKYDENTGLMILRAEYNREGEIYYQIESEYDQSTDPPRLIADAWKDKAGSLIKRLAYDYDENGEIVIERNYDSNNRLTGFYQFEYDERYVNLLKKEWYGPGEELRSFFAYDYDANDNVTRATLFDGSGKMESSQLYFYDGIGNIVEEKWFDDDGEMFKHIKY